ncbi:penicillin-binding protein 2 [Beggiatoa leptomitoformis]|uniref:Peptidoglycan D,D-transpeptidase MrdA n=1 Tax=Beggiatoa leptomitoformis TaxID=288004 RepID=A0A2N9YGZ4_9GAMM|nr:penicillin-binding protein 2 [Beggiatoa leptomitoformis]ALG67977.1 penicillin-binding protein 2 [Beggiatoa leptomitoformis]AUI69743.1 penicillin-binding protein 2 [Beggiatoa leptomitoformis]
MSSPRQTPFILKDVVKENHIFKSRLIIAWLCMMVGLSLIVTRLVFLQVINHERYTTLSEKNRLKILPLPPTRGLIYDRNGVVLAENRTSYTLEVVPEQVEGELDDMLQRLGQVVRIEPSEIERFKRQLKLKRRFDSIPLRFRLTELEVAKFSVQRHRFQGVDITANLSRYYPLGNTGSHVIGYVGRISEQELQNIDQSNYSGSDYIGKTGVEKTYETELHGKVGFQQVETNVTGRVVRVLERTPPIPGKNLYLNIDIKLQTYAEQVLANERGAIVAIEPDKGAILALASMPNFDPNLFVNGIDTKTYHSLLYAPERPLFNRALRGQYPPGSTVKAFVGIAGLEYGLRTENSRTWCPGWYSLPDYSHRYRDWKKTGHGFVNLRQAIEQSCDVYFYSLANDLGIDRLHNFMTRFGFGKPTGIDIDGELGGLMPSREWKRDVRKSVWFPGETLIAGIGQGFVLATPLQLAVATATLSMHGQIRQPRVVFTVDDTTSNESVLVRAEPKNAITLKYDEYWQLGIAGMMDVVHGNRGTARKVGLGSAYHFAGKTGTAQVVGIKQDEKYDAKRLEKRFHDHALFIAFAPIEEPRIAVAVIVENGGSGSGTAAPIAKKVMDYYLLGSAPTEPTETPTTTSIGGRRQE